MCETRRDLQIQAIQEIARTEASYLRQMDVLIRFFVEPAEHRQILDKKSLNCIFGNVREIVPINQLLYDQYLRNATSVSQICASFDDGISHFLKQYAFYARNFTSAQEMLIEKQRSNRVFKTFCTTQESRPELNNLKLAALLIMPVQRILRYKLLLETLKRYSPESDHDSITKLVTQMDEIASICNDGIDDYDNANEIIRISHLFGGRVPKLLCPGRKLIKEGPIRKILRSNSIYKDYYMFLFTDFILLAKPQSGRRSRFVCRAILPLRHCYIVRAAGSIIKISCKKETFLLGAQSELYALEWMTSFDMAIHELLQARNTLRKDSTCNKSFYTAVAKMKKFALLPRASFKQDHAASNGLLKNESQFSGFTGFKQIFSTAFRSKQSRPPEKIHLKNKRAKSKYRGHPVVSRGSEKCRIYALSTIEEEPLVDDHAACTSTSASSLH